jgi:hypothetical protein
MVKGLGFRVVGFRVCRVVGLGFRILGLQSLGFKGLRFIEFTPYL